MSISSWITTPSTRHPRSKRGSPAGPIIMSTSRRLPRHGSIRSSAGSLNSPESRSSEGVHTSVKQVEAEIHIFIDLHNRNQKPFKWTKSADKILASVKRFRHKAQQTLSGELEIHVTS